MALYILGNGFDLAHGLKTRYSDFRDYLAKKQRNKISSLLDTLESVYDQDKLWSDFERALGNPNENFIKEVNALFGIDLFGSLFIGKLRQEFKSWIQEAIFSKLEVSPRYPLSNNDKFISFNYTQVLEFVYAISDANILHIHGCVELDKFKDDIFVLGHNKEINKDSPEILKATKKDTSKVIANNSKILKEFMSRCHEVKMIGFSYSDIDLPYFIYLTNLNRDAVWNFGYYSDNDKQRIQKYITAMRLEPDQVKLFCTDNRR